MSDTANAKPWRKTVFGIVENSEFRFNAVFFAYAIAIAVYPAGIVKNLFRLLGIIIFKSDARVVPRQAIYDARKPDDRTLQERRRQELVDLWRSSRALFGWRGLQ